MVFPDLEAGGAQRVGLMLARQFVAAGHDVDLVLLQSTGRFQDSIPEGVRVVALYPSSPKFGRQRLAFLVVIRLASWLRRCRPEYILSTVTGTNLATLLARRLSGVSSKLAIREAVTLENVRTRSRLQAMRWMYPWADTIIAVSSAVADQLITRIGVNSTRVHCIPNPVDTSMLKLKAKSPLNHPWLDDKRKRVVISVGRLVPQKGYEDLIRAFSHLPEKYQAYLILVGDGPDHIKLKRLASSLHIAHRVDLVGFDENPWRWIVRADLFVLPSFWEGNPNSLLEALALGCPAIATAYDQSVDELSARHGFMVVPVGDTKALQQALTQCLSMPSVLQPGAHIPSPESVAQRYSDVMHARA